MNKLGKYIFRESLRYIYFLLLITFTCSSAAHDHDPISLAILAIIRLIIMLIIIFLGIQLRMYEIIIYIHTRELATVDQIVQTTQLKLAS